VFETSVQIKFEGNMKGKFDRVKHSLA
jgi:hypothetical protein